MISLTVMYITVREIKNDYQLLSKGRRTKELMHQRQSSSYHTLLEATKFKTIK